MAVTVYCRDPQGLLGEIKAAIRNGTVDTWLVDTDGDFTHSPLQWKNQAWFRPSVELEKLVFHIMGTKIKRMTRPVYGVYHGRFIEMLLTHFDLKFTQAVASALPVFGDRVGKDA